MKDNVEMRKNMVRKFKNLMRDFKDYLDAAGLRSEDDAEFKARFEELAYDIANRYDYLHPHDHS